MQNSSEQDAHPSSDPNDELDLDKLHCIYCETAPAELVCMSCEGDVYCAACFGMVHRKGHLSTHSFTKLEKTAVRAQIRISRIDEVRSHNVFSVP